MKTRIILLFSLLVLQSCYSPKTDIEKDQYPEIPEFPKFSDPAVYAEKVMELPLSQSSNCFYQQKDDYFFIYNYPGPERSADMLCRIFIIKNGKPVISESWKDIPKTNNFAFVGDHADLYVNNRRYLAPDYTRKEIFPIYDLNDVQSKYEHLFHAGEHEKDSVLFRKIAMEQKQLQNNILSRIKEIRYIDDEANSGIMNYPSAFASYLCNPDSKAPFYIMPDFLEEPKDAFETRNASYRDSLYGKLRPKMTLVSKENKFTRKISTSFADSTFFKEKGRIVTGNAWFSRGNHYVASFGYSPVYMYYYDLKIRNKTISTKEDHTKMMITSIAKTASGKYFLVNNLKAGKFQVYFLRN
ncbi:hypothetical protein [Chryseobacterium indologenes]|uniref:Lipoprotein n=1 Tax=Chryseobacterium indologenes TaxID=253 RepID=A0A0N0ZSK8_CHRID|nr:hypothetical protein [Chryseobacterium indologenes]KPE49380.1 hypothetical protein AOB46_20595 [Chryseobacterium indologenes]